eukprot:g411.t1
MRGFIVQNCNEASDDGAITVNSKSVANFIDMMFVNNTNRALFVQKRSQASISHSTFESNSINDAHGGGIYVRNEAEISVSNSQFIGNQGKGGGAIAIYSEGNATITNSFFSGNRGKIGGAIYVRQNSTTRIEDCSFAHNSATNKGGAIGVDDYSNLDLYNSNLSSNRALVGGSLYTGEFSNVTTMDCNFSLNMAERTGGAIDVDDYSKLDLYNSNLSSNRALVGGSLYTGGFSNATTIDCEFSLNIAKRTGGAIRVSDNSSLFVSNTIFSSNEAENGGSVSMDESGMTIVRGGNFTNNSARRRGGAIQVEEYSILKLLNVTLSVDKRLKTVLENIAELGGSIHLSESSNGSIEDCKFVRNFAVKRGGAILVEEYSFIRLHGTTLLRNVASLGGSMYLSDFTLGEISNSIFTQNLASVSGGGVHSTRMSNATILNSTFISNEALRGGGLFAIEASHIFSIGISMISNIATDQGGGIAIVNASSFLCESCKVERNKAFSGAGMYIYTNQSLSIVVQMQESKFEGNKAESHGAGVELSAPQIDNPSSSSSNNSSGDPFMGYLVLLNTDFTYNYATFTGAAILTTDPEKVKVSCKHPTSPKGRFLTTDELTKLPSVDPEHLCESWKNNSVASEAYKGVIGTYGRVISVSMEFNDKVKLTGTRSTGLVIENVSSGEKLPVIYITILDGYGMGPAPTLPYSFEARLTSVSDFFYGAYSATISAGSGNFSKAVGFAPPGKYTLEIISSNKAVANVWLSVVVRECVVGEEPTQDHLRCQECNSNQYNFNVSEIGGCKQCPEHADCSGNFIAPRHGYWHMSPCHETLKQCISEKACRYKGRQSHLLNYTRNSTTCNLTSAFLEGYDKIQCEEGYKGRLCGTCADSYGLSSSFECEKCRHVAFSILVLIGSIAYLFVGTAGTVLGVVASQQSHRPNRTENQSPLLEISSHDPPEREASSSSSGSNENPQSTQDFSVAKTRLVQTWKILVNFLQVASTARGMEVRWTDDTMETLDGMQTLGAATINSVSSPIDCLVSSHSYMIRSVLRVFLSLFIPIAVILIFALCWLFLAVRKYSTDQSYFKRRLLLTVVAVIYLVYFDMTQLAVKVFNCVAIPDDDDPYSTEKTRYWIANTSIKCYHSKAHLFLMLIALVILMSISISFPLVCAFNLFRQRGEIESNKSWTNDTMGFLCGPFKDKFVYWECIIMIKKGLLSIIVVYSYSLGSQAQGLLTILALIFFLYIHLVSYPFSNEYHSLNYYEAASLMVSGVIYTLIQFLNIERYSDFSRHVVSMALIGIGVGYVVVMVFILFKNLVQLLKSTVQSSGINVSDDMSWFDIIKLYYNTRRFRNANANVNT